MTTLSPEQLAELERRLREHGHENACANWTEQGKFVQSPEHCVTLFLFREHPDTFAGLINNHWVPLIAAYRSGFESWWREHLGMPRGPSSASPSHALPAVPDVPPVEPLGTYCDSSRTLTFRDAQEDEVKILGGSINLFFDCSTAIDLTRLQVRTLIAHLTQWAENGTLKLPN